jgi:hypothetical protein
MVSPESTKSLKRSVLCISLLLLISAGSARAQNLTAYADTIGIPYGMPLVVEPFGVLDNDILDGENAGESGATAELVTNVNHGTLVLNPNGSFDYSPGSTFDGMDSFVYRAVFGVVSDSATVTLTACNGGPDVFVCWNESAFLAKAAEYDYIGFQEGFEDDAVWGLARYPNTAASVISQGVQWQSNYPDSPDWNEITTGSGAALTGDWGIYDPDHGSANGSSLVCDVNDPPDSCLYHDGVTGIMGAGMNPLHGVGGYITGSHGANVGIVLDDSTLYNGGQISPSYQFFGVIDTRPAGFRRFEFRELDGKIGQALFIWADDFTLLSEAPTAVSKAGASRTPVFFACASPNPSNGTTALRFSLPARANVRLNIYDARGRLVRRLSDETRGAGAHVIQWNGRDDRGHGVPTGIYFGRLMVTGQTLQDVQARKIIVIH